MNKARQDFDLARVENTPAAWHAVAAQFRSLATTTPATQEQRDAANMAAYCEHRAAGRQKAAAEGRV